MRGDATSALVASKALEALSREHGMALQQIWAEMTSGWAHGRLHDPKGGAARLQRALGALAEIGGAVDTAFYLGLLAQLEAEAFGIEGASARVAKTFALGNQVVSLAYLTLWPASRGDVLLKRDPDDTSSAEDAFREAIAVAKDRKSARSFQLVQATLRLAERKPRPISARREVHTVPRVGAGKAFADAGDARDRRGAGVAGAL